MSEPRRATQRMFLSLIIAVGVTLAVALVLTMRALESQNLQQVFREKASDRVESIQHGLDEVLELMHGVRGLYDASEAAVASEGFAVYTALALNRHPSILAIYWLPRVMESDRAAFEQRIGHPIVELGRDPVLAATRAVYFPVEHVASLHALDAFGRDHAADPFRRLAMAAAVREDASRATSLVQLAVLDGMSGVLIYLPVFRKDLPTHTPDARDAALAGFIACVIDPAEVVEGALAHLAPAGVDIAVRDHDSGTLLYRHASRTRDGDLRAGLPFTWHGTIIAAGRAWTAEATPAPSFGQTERFWQSWAVVTVGVLFLGLLVFNLAGALRRSDTVDRLVEERTAALRASEERYRQMMDNAPDPIILLGMTGFIDAVNPAAERVSGYSREELVGKHLGTVGVLAPASLGAALKEFTLILGGQPRPPREYEMVAKDGRRMVMEAHGQSLRHGNTVSGIQVIMRDVTLRREAAEREQGRQQELRDKSQEIEQHNLELRHQEQIMHSLLEDMQAAKARLEERDKLLQETNQRLQEMAALKDEFVAKVSHELRTPLTSIKEGLNLLLDNALGETNAEQQDFLKTMDADIDRLAELINNMLDIAKIEGSGMRLRRKRLDVRDVALAASRSLQFLAGSRTLTVDCPEGLVVFGDHDRLIQVFNNLLSNAIKFTPPEGTITIRGRIRDGSVTVAVKDSGAGISPEDLPKLFKKFSQVGAFDPNRPRGTGLGLVVCKELVEMHGGTIEASSQPGQGSVFTMRLPAYTDEIALEQSFHDLTGPAAAAGHSIALVAIDASAVLGEAPKEVAGSMLASLVEDVRRHMHRGDAIVPVGNRWVVVLAACSPDGPRAIVRRLRGALGGYELRYGTGVHPADGNTAAQLFAHASATLDAGMAAPDSAASEPMKERPA